MGLRRLLIVGLIALVNAFTANVWQGSTFAQEDTNVVAPPTEESPAPPPTEEQTATNEESAATENQAQEAPEQPPRPQQPTVTVPPPRPLSVPQPAPPAVVPPEQATIEFEFQGASLNAILEWYAKLTNRSIISAPNLAGTINFRSQTKLTKDEAIQALDSVLAINNIAAIPLGDKFLKVVQITTAAQEGIPFWLIISDWYWVV